MKARLAPRTREEQRLLTRAMICSSARILFQSRGVDNISVEQIASEANVTRSTFYLHFKSKEDVLREVLQDVMLDQQKDYVALVETEHLDYDVVRAWLDEYHRAFVERSKTLPLFRDLARLSPAESQSMILVHRQRTLGILGTRFAALRLSNSRQEDERMRALAHMFLFQLEGAITYFSATDGAPNAAVGLDIIAEQMVSMLPS